MNITWYREIIKLNSYHHTDSAQYKTPVFKLKNRVTGKYLASPPSPDNDVTQEDAGSDWYVRFLSAMINFLYIVNGTWIVEIRNKKIHSNISGPGTDYLLNLRLLPAVCSKLLMELMYKWKLWTQVGKESNSSIWNRMENSSIRN